MEAGVAERLGSGPRMIGQVSGSPRPSVRRSGPVHGGALGRRRARDRDRVYSASAGSYSGVDTSAKFGPTPRRTACAPSSRVKRASSWELWRPKAVGWWSWVARTDMFWPGLLGLTRPWPVGPTRPHPRRMFGIRDRARRRWQHLRFSDVHVTHRALLRLDLRLDSLVAPQTPTPSSAGQVQVCV